MRIAAISHSCVVTVNQQLYVELAKRPGVELILVSPLRWVSSLRRSTAYAALPALGDAARPLPVVSPGKMHTHWYKGLGPVLRDFGPDIIFADEEPYSFVAYQALGWATRLGCRFALYAKQTTAKRYPPPISWNQARVLRGTDHALVINPDAERALRAHGYSGECTELPHGMDPDFMRPQDSAELRARLKVGGPTAGYVGRLSAEKGLWDLLAAEKLLAGRRGCEHTLLVIGDGPDRWALQEAAAKDLPAGRVQFLGSVRHEAVPAYLNALDMLVLPSRTQPNWKEQFGRVLVEALACGVPVVGSDSGHIPVLINETGGGVIHREGDPADLADKIASLLQDPAQGKELAGRGRQVVLDRYSYASVAGTLYEALRKAVEDRAELHNHAG